MNTFEWEKEAQKYFNTWYENKGWTYTRIEGKENESGDVRVSKNGKEFLIEEKSERIVTNNMCVELIQDVDSVNLGWMFKTKADYINYIQCDGEDITKVKHHHMIHMEKLTTHLFHDGNSVRINETDKGFGRTINCLIPWSILTMMGIAKNVMGEHHEKN